MRFRTGVVLLSGTGATLIAAAQTNAAEAASNISSWIDALGTAPAFLANQSADAWVTILGLSLIAGSLGYAAIRKSGAESPEPPPAPPASRGVRGIVYGATSSGGSDSGATFEGFGDEDVAIQDDGQGNRHIRPKVVRPSGDGERKK